MQRKLLFVIGTAMIFLAVVLSVPICMDYKKAETIYHNLNKSYVVCKEEQPDGQNGWYTEVDIKLGELAEENSDIIGWIRFDAIEALSYPILYSGDDDTYLRTDIYGNSSISGCIFMEGACQPDFEDCHTILYGHNMKNGSMFGSLKQYKTDGFYENNRYFTIYTKDMAYRYEIFAYRDVSETDAVYTIGFAPDEVFEEFINEMIRNSYEDTAVAVNREDKVLTLSTCSSRGNRFVVHAVRVDAHAYE